MNPGEMNRGRKPVGAPPTGLRPRFMCNGARSVRHGDRLAACAGGEGGHDRVGGVGEKADGTVGEEPIAAARVQAPEVVAITRVINPPGAKALQRDTRLDRVTPSDDRHGSVQTWILYPGGVHDLSD